MTEFTAHFRLPVPDFNQEPWHDQFRDLCVAIDDMAFNALLGNASVWTNSTPYAISDIVLDDTNAMLYVCAIAHVSPPTPTTFLEFRDANPTYWNQIAQVPQQRGTWTTATTYIVGDFVIDNSRYAVCIESHVSTVFNADLGAGKWSVLIDLSGLSVGINGLTEAAISAAPTTDLATVATSQVLVTGSGQFINSFGTGAELFKILRFDGANSIMNNAPSLVLVGEVVSKVTVPGDVMIFRSDSVGNWRELTRLAASSINDRGIIQIATQPTVDTGTNSDQAVVPSTLLSFWNTKFDAYFPAGTRVVMQQTTPPAGWTKDLTHNDKALRVVSGAAGSGGVNAFSTVFSKTGTDNFTLTATEMPAHQHDAFIGDDGHFHTYTLPTATSGYIPDAAAGFINSTTQNTSTKVTGVRVRSTAGSAAGADDKVSSVGGGSPHLHAMDIRVQFVDTVIAVRN